MVNRSAGPLPAASFRYRLYAPSRSEDLGFQASSLSSLRIWAISRARALARDNPSPLFNLLFHNASRPLLEFGQSRLDAQLGFTVVLHTWNRELVFHPHIHCIVTGGGLNDHQDHWNAANPHYLFPVKAMSRLFRGKFLDAHQRAYNEDELDLSGKAAHLADPSLFRELKDNDSGVCFATKNGNTITVSAEEFIRRFLLHVLPKGFVKIRHYGLMASSNATTKLEVARQLLEEKTKSTTDAADMQASCGATEAKDWRERFMELTGIDLTICPRCNKGPMVRYPLSTKLRRIDLQSRSPPDEL